MRGTFNNCKIAMTLFIPLTWISVELHSTGRPRRLSLQVEFLTKVFVGPKISVP